ncbi:MAG: hypothetical protein RLY61_139 [Candidatus Parcubacteria bacterium]|jgi:hypothetical protein
MIALTDVKNVFTTVLTDLKKQNEYSTWKNLTLGLTVVLLVVIFSVAYFNRLSQSLEIQPLSAEQTASTQPKVQRQLSTKTPKSTKEEKVTVQEGEGLWHVALRVCGTGEAYSKLAEANNLTIDSEVFVGQELLRKCN